MLLSDAAADAAAAFQYDVGTPPGVTPDNSGSWINAISQLASQGLSLYAQMQLQNMNMDLIKQGKPPLSSAQMSSMAPQLNVGLAPAMQNTLLYVLLGGGAVVLLASFMKSPRRTRR